MCCQHNSGFQLFNWRGDKRKAFFVCREMCGCVFLVDDRAYAASLAREKEDERRPSRQKHPNKVA